MNARPPHEGGSPGLVDRAAGSVVLALARGLGALPAPLGDALGDALGTVAYCADVVHRRRAVENLLRAGLAQDAAGARRMACEVFRNLGRSVADLCRLPRLTPSALAARVRVEGYDRVRAAQALGRGVILVTAHLGAWELLPVVSAMRGNPLHVVVRPMDNATLDRAITAIRTRGGNGVIRKQDLMRAGPKVLKAGGTLGILMDQNITWREGVFVEFFGRLANTAYAPALLALRTGATVLPVAIFREGPGRHVVVVEEAIEVSRSGDLRRDLQENTARFTRAIEAFIRRSPTAWFWVHRRWKTQPLPPDGDAGAWEPPPPGRSEGLDAAPARGGAGPRGGA